MLKQVQTQYDSIVALKPIIEKHMINELPLKVPIEVGMGTGENWLEAH